MSKIRTTQRWDRYHRTSEDRIRFLRYGSVAVPQAEEEIPDTWISTEETSVVEGDLRYIRDKVYFARRVIPEEGGCFSFTRTFTVEWAPLPKEPA